MDWTLAIEKNREALKRILATLVAMVAVAGGEARPATLPRYLHRSVLRLLRPAEAAARRLIIVAARGLVVELAPTRPQVVKRAPLRNRSNGFGTGIVIRPGPLPEWALKLAPKRSAALSLPLFDPLKRFGVRRRYVAKADLPRIRSFDDPRPAFLHPPPAVEPLRSSPDDLIDAGRLARRLEAIGRALDDLPGHAKRLARLLARRDAYLKGARNADIGEQGGSAAVPAGNAGASTQNGRRFQRFEPLRPGRPPGWRRKPGHPVDETLNELHGLAVWAHKHWDTS